MQEQISRAFRLSPQQRRLWQLHYRDRELYRARCVVAIEGNIHPDILRESLSRAIARNEIFRTSFEIQSESAPEQVVRDHADLWFHTTDFRSMTGEQQQIEIDSLLGGAGNSPDESGELSPLRASLAALAGTKYALVICAPALCADSWSLKRLVREIALGYEAILSGSEPDDSPLQYAELAEWQNELFESGESNLGKQFWRSLGVFEIDCLTLPFETRQPGTYPFKPAVESFDIDPRIAARLEERARDNKTPLSVLLLTCWQTLLSRLADRQELAVMARFDGRNYEELEDALGLFARYVPVNFRRGRNERLSDLAQQVAGSVLDAAKWQECFDWDLLSGSNGDLREACSRGFAFDFEDLTEHLSVVNSVFSIEKLFACIDRFKVRLSFVRSRKQLTAELHYDASRVPADEARRLASRLEAVLGRVAETSDVFVGDIDVLSEAERKRILTEFNDSAGERPRHNGFHQIFEEQLEGREDSIAVVCEGHYLTYQELNSRANRLALRLLSLGVAPESSVGILLGRSVNFIIAMLGVLKAGAAYLPLDPKAPGKRLTRMIEDARARLVLTEGSFLDLLFDGGARSICLDEEWQKIAALSDANLGLHTLGAHPAYVIYTSGSSGQPKGVVIEHRQLMNYVAAALDRLRVGSEKSFATVSTFAADLGNTTIFASLASGGCLHIITHERASDPEALADYFQSHAIDCLKVVPSHLSALLLCSNPARLLPRERLVLGGEVCHWEMIDKLRQIRAGCQIMNHYGPTETTVGVATYNLEDTRARLTAETVPLGSPIRNVQIYMLDGNFSHVPIGVPGELHIGGESLARGYFNLPEKTAEKFLPNPFSEASGGRLYATGDLARFLPDGSIEYLGRIDRQIKLRGFRIEPGEIEARLNEHPVVHRGLVTVRESSHRDRRLIAYVVPDRIRAGAGSPQNHGDWIDSIREQIVTELRDYLKGHLPDHMIPSSFVILGRLPLTANGKTDFDALPDPDENGFHRGESLVEPKTDLEIAIADIWKQVLRIDRVALHDSFFSLGGDSILSIQVIARASRLGIKLTPRMVFEHQTVAELAGAAGLLPVFEADQTMVAGPVPLTPIQHWFFESDPVDRHHWNQSLMLEVNESLEADQLRRIVEKIFHHHDALRMRFIQDETGWRQINKGIDEPIALTQIDLSEADSNRSDLIEQIAEGAQSSLDLSSGPIARILLIGCGSGEPCRLLIIVHHLVFDGVSWRILLEDLQAAYRQVKAGEPVELAAKTTSFKQWAERLQSYAASEELAREYDYWVAALPPAPSLLPVDHPGGLNTEASARAVSVTLSADETTSLLQEVPKAYNTQINEALLTALGLAVFSWTGGASALIDLEGHGREDLYSDVDLSRTVGMFTTHFPVVVDDPPGFAPADVLKATKDKLRGIPNRGLGCEVLRYLCPRADIRNKLKAAPAPEVSFNYLGQFDQVIADMHPFSVAQERSGQPRSLRRTRRCMIEVLARIVGGRLRVQFVYSVNLHSDETIQAVAFQFLEELRGLIAHCISRGSRGYTPADFPLARFDQQALDRVVGERTNIEDIYPLSPTQHGMLFHTLYDPGLGVYLEQLNCRLYGDLDVTAFERTWQRVVDRHSILRTAFVQENFDEPLQLVCSRVLLPLHDEDLRMHSQPEQEARLREYLRADREQGLTPSQAPLMRLALFRTEDFSYHFIWTYHHLLLDGWSAPLLMREVFDIYRSLRSGEDPVLAKARPYRDYIEWFARQDAAKAESYWRKLLDGHSAPTTPGVDQKNSRANPVEQRFASKFLRLSAENTAALQAWARGNQLTLNTVMVGAWALLLSRFSGSDSVVFGTTVSGRPPDLPGVEKMIGLFINTLPVRARIAGNLSTLDWLKSMQSEQAEMRQYEYSSLVQIQGWSDVPRGVPMFESLLVFENYPVDDAFRHRGSSGLGLEFGRVDIVEQAHYPLTLTAGGDHQLLLEITYDGARYDGETAGCLLDHLQMIFDGFIASPERELADIPLVTQNEAAKVLDEWNRTEAIVSSRACVHELFETVAAARADAIAIECEGHFVTYGELNRRSNQLAHHLVSMDARPETLIGVFVERSLEMAIAILGVLKAGSGYVPIDPSEPQQRAAFIAADANVRIILTLNRLKAKLTGIAASLTTIDSDVKAIEQQSGENPSGRAAEEAAAYAIYTSGSTGNPKGALVTHRSLVSYATSISQSFELSERDRVLQFASPAFDVVVEELFPTWISGGAVVLERYLPLDAGHEFSDFIDNYQLSWVELPTGYWQQWVHELTGGRAGLPSCLRFVAVGGEKMAPDGVAGWNALKKPLMHVFGLTETTVTSTVKRIVATGDETGSFSVGRPIGNTTLYVLDSHLRPVPVGAPGELYIGGDGVGRGYVSQPGMTAERFIPDPFSRRGVGRLYKTGDLVRYRRNGDLEILGRLDNQLKVRGFRIEPGEIEEELCRHPGVREAAVVVKETKEGEKELVAFVVGAEEVDADELKRSLKSRIPEHMVPRWIVTLKRMPVNASGKIDRKRLPEADWSIEEPAERRGGGTQIEDMLAGMWCQVLGVEHVGREDNFFLLGGHSLLATQLISRVRTGFNVDIPLRSLFESASMGALAREIDAALTSHKEVRGRSIEPVPQDAELPLSFGQQRLWFLDQLEPGNFVYNVPLAVRLSGRLKTWALGQAIGEIINRHQVLRTAFFSRAGRPSQKVHPTQPIVMRVVDLSGLLPDDGERRARGLATEEAQRGFDLEQGPLLRATLLRLGERNHVMLMTMHHIACDGWSIGIFVREAATLYASFSSGEQSALVPLRIQYADFAYWQRQWLDGEVLQSQLLYWKKQLGGGLPVLKLTSDRAVPRTRRYIGGHYPLAVPPDLTREIRQLSRREGATVFMTLLAAFNVLLSRYTGQDDIVVGVDIANRTHVDTESLIGFFINMLVMRTDLSENPRFFELLGRVRELALDAYANQDVPFEKLVEEFQPDRTRSHSPLFQVAFVFEQAPPQAAAMPEISLSPFQSDHNSVRFDMSLMITEERKQLRGGITYDRELFDESRIENMAGRFVALLQSIVQRPDARLDALEILTDAERRERIASRAAREESNLGKLMRIRSQAARTLKDDSRG